MVEESSLAAAASFESISDTGDVPQRPWLGVWILHGNYSSSLLLDAIPFTDPLITLQSLASGHLPGDGGVNGSSYHHGAVCPGR